MLICWTKSISCVIRSWTALVPLSIFIASPVAAEHPPRTPPKTEPGTATVELSRACPGKRWIGMLKEKRSKYRAYQRCPNGWEPLFTSTQGPLPPGLQRFCLFKSKTPTDPRRKYLREGKFIVEPGGRIYYERGEFDRIDPDCPVVGPAAKTFFKPEELHEALTERIRREAGVAPSGLSAGKVRLVIVDSVEDSTEPEKQTCKPTTGRGDRECSPHGWALAELAEEVLGDTVEITSRRALMRTYTVQAAGSQPDEVVLPVLDAQPSGGLFGYWSELGAALTREVIAWWGEGPGRPKLVLNLSVGWEAMYGSDVAVVRVPIEVAVCSGALVVAAAGNRRAGPESLEEPLLPAAWEQFPAPNAARCEVLLGVPTPPLASVTQYRPLLYAVGGVAQDGRRLSNAKPRATPRLVAFGDHASVLHAAASPPRLTTLTGTSVSTLLVSAAAVAHWGSNPDLSSFDVMEQLRAAGEESPVGPLVDFCWQPNLHCPLGTVARRIMVGPPEASPQSDLPIDTSLITASLVQLSEPSRLEGLLSCDPQVLAYQESPSPNPNPVLCPQRSLFDVAAQPWLGPSPEANHNPDCRYTEGSPGTLVLEFDPCFRIEGMPVELDNFTLVAGNLAHRLPIEKFTLGDPNEPCPLPDDPRRVQVVLNGFSFEGLHPMYLAVTLNGQYATITPILQVLK